ncbi:hypothetical protein EJB05_14222, partial [Eragrostis curvula]
MIVDGPSLRAPGISNTSVCLRPRRVPGPGKPGACLAYGGLDSIDFGIDLLLHGASIASPSSSRRIFAHLTSAPPCARGYMCGFLDIGNLYSGFVDHGYLKHDSSTTATRVSFWLPRHSAQRAVIRMSYLPHPHRHDASTAGGCQSVGFFSSLTVCEVPCPPSHVLSYIPTEGLNAIQSTIIRNSTLLTLMTAEDGSLGFAGVKDSNLFLWSWKADSKGIAGWEQLRVIKLNTLLSLPEGAWVSSCGFMEGTDTIFISTSVSIFTLKLKSGQIRNVGPRSGYGPIVPYMNYYTRGFVVARLLSP